MDSLGSALESKGLSLVSDESGRVVLVDLTGGLPNFSVDFQKYKKDLKNIGNRSDPLHRLFVNEDEVVDASCGWAKDAYHLHLLGKRVVAFERNPIVERVVHASLEIDSVPIDLRLGSADAKSIKGRAVFFDPMFSKAKGKRLSRLGMQWLQRLCGEDVDQEEFISFVLRSGCKKIVVKRSPQYRGPSVSGRKPNHVHVFSKVIYETYF